MISNRVTEKDLRDWLDRNGFAGRFAKLRELELHAIKSPGWLQVFRFSIEVRRKNPDDSDGEPPLLDARPMNQFWGVIVDDERKSASRQTEVFLFETQPQQLRMLSEVSEDLIKLKSRGDGKPTDYLYAGISLAAFVVVMLGLAWLAEQFG